MCFYSKPTHCTKNSPNNLTHLTKDLKTHYNCPFEIRFNFVGFKIDDKKLLTFYQVKITHLNVEHTCKLSTLYHCRALQKGRRLCLDVSKLQTIILLLREKPWLDTRMLQPCLEKHLPHYKGVSAAFVSNFHKHVFKYCAQKGEDEELTMDEAHRLLHLHLVLQLTKSLIWTILLFESTLATC
jgi:hypothetical protein